MTQASDNVSKALTAATAEANDAFGKLRDAIEGADGAQIDVLETARRGGLEIDEKILEELQIPRHVHIHPWLPWHYWFPWRPLWCWWWRRHYRFYWYRCCPWWWHRCHYHRH